ncbi:hypothetical protein [Sandaracinus amylolyticus]|uniref:hypothetical protein n=1 Tax=Sandaracinus amylolyticus TaxID=927083 RepID=UPI001F16C3F3|nr:hypothetical protein [Sandaracinus amylolyticus]UJR79528.1 Hypothetical protein I5071_15640 [Sandaracinus amylolyticus]
MQRESLARGFRITTKVGALTLEHEAPGVALLRVERAATGETMVPVFEALEPVIARHGSIVVFIDGEALESYDTDCRRRWTSWLSEHRGKVVVHVLVRSRLLQMGVNLVNPLIGGFIVSHSERSSFEAELRKARVRSRDHSAASRTGVSAIGSEGAGSLGFARRALRRSIHPASST